jgi:hypothetical protein
MPLPAENLVVAPTPPISWSAVVAGAVASMAISLMLLAFGFGMGFSSVSPWPSAGASLTSFAIGGAIWLLIVQWASSAFGGYLTGRLRRRWTTTHSHEVFFRDTAHGFLAWAIATIFSVVALSSAAGALVHAGSVVASSASADSSASSLTPQSYYVDKMLRTTSNAPGGDDALRAQVGRILTVGLTNGQLTGEDHDYLADLVAARTSIPRPDAQRRVDETFAAEKQAEDKARAAAETARKASARFSFYLFFSMVVGAFIACVSSAIGGGQRDEIEDRFPFVESRPVGGLSRS